MNTRAPDYPAIVGWISRAILRIFGWQIVGSVPDFPKLVAIGGPHTSNWDGFVFILFTFAMRTRMYWLGKHSLFRPPFGWLMRLASGVSINRNISQNAVEQAVQAFNERERMVLMIAPEGTRQKTDHWKTGFYYIALGAKTPIAMAFLDYPRKRAGMGPYMIPTGDIEADFAIFQQFYADKVGRHPEKKSDIVPQPAKKINHIESN